MELTTFIASGWLSVLGFIFGGCCSNVFALESLVREVPKSGNLITFAQFLFITLICLPSYIHVPAGKLLPRLRPRQVPLRRWAVMVALYFCVSVLNNVALGYRISIPLHIVFRSSGLIANMACGYLVMHKRYPAKQVLAVCLVSVGVVLATLASVSAGQHQAKDVDEHVNESIIGIALLTMGVFLAAMLGLYQETTYKKYGKHWQEGLFYNHVLALPMFLFFRNDILAQMRALSVSRPVNLAALPVVGPLCPNISVPSLWVSLVANILSQLVCVSGVHRLTSMSSSLTLNVVLNLRKLVSLVLSVVLFKNSVNAGMVAGCLMVFVGTFAYSQTNQLLPPKQQSAVKSDSGSEVVVASAMDQPKTPALKQVNRPSTQKREP